MLLVSELFAQQTHMCIRKPLIIQWVFSDIHRWTRSATTIKHHSGLLTEQLSRYPGETRCACLPAAAGWADSEARALGGAAVWGRDAGEAVRPWWVNKFETRLGSRNGGIGSGSRKIVVHSKPIWCLNGPTKIAVILDDIVIYISLKSLRINWIMSSWQYIIIWSGNGLAPSRLEPMMILGLITRFFCDKLITIGLGNDILIYSSPSYPPEPTNLIVN